MNLAAFLGISSFIMTSSNATMKTMVYGHKSVEQVQRLLPSLKKIMLLQIFAVSLHAVYAKDVLGDTLPHS